MVTVFDIFCVEKLLEKKNCCENRNPLFHVLYFLPPVINYYRCQYLFFFFDWLLPLPPLSVISDQAPQQVTGMAKCKGSVSVKTTLAGDRKGEEPQNLCFGSFFLNDVFFSFP